jgi:hypothetical protein
MPEDTQYRLLVRSLVRGKGSLRGLRLPSGAASLPERDRGRLSIGAPEGDAGN